MLRLLLFIIIHESYFLLTRLPYQGYLLLRRWAKYLIKREPHDIWLYASGLGEIIALENLISSLQAKRPQYRILITCGTSLGMHEAQRRYSTHTVTTAPARWSVSTLLFLWHYAPTRVCMFDIQLETAYVAMAKLYCCTLISVNALLAHVQPKNRRQHYSYAFKLKQFDHIFTDATAAARSFKLSPTQCHIVPATTISNTIEKQQTYQPVVQSTATKSVLLVGSIRSEELSYYLSLFSTLKKQGHHIHLMLVPRTLWWTQRAEAAIQKHTSSYQVWHHQDQPNTTQLLTDIVTAIENTDISFVAQMGILFDLYPYATLFYLGGTFNHIGGHNVLEPAAWHIPIIVGPHVAVGNIMGRQLLAAGGAQQARTSEELFNITNELLQHPEHQKELTQRANQWLDNQYQASRGTITQIIETL